MPRKGRPRSAESWRSIAAGTGGAAGAWSLGAWELGAAGPRPPAPGRAPSRRGTAENRRAVLRFAVVDCQHFGFTMGRDSGGRARVHTAAGTSLVTSPS